MQQQDKTTFTMTHISMALKYGGISFIAGAVSHGVFSGQRAFFTALLGLVAFMLGTWLENRDSDSVKGDLLKALAISSLLGISLGFFSGSLQHFPDSPFRSVWVVPLGFLLSLIALGLSHKQPITANIKRYAAISFAVVLTGSLSAYGYYSQNPVAGGHGHGGHAHGETASNSSSDDHSQHGQDETAKKSMAQGHDHSQHGDSMVAQVKEKGADKPDHSQHDHGSHQANALVGEPGKVSDVERTIEVDMTDNMRYSPNSVTVKAGETLRIIAKNSGNIPHELTLGTPLELQEHAKMMLKMPGMAHDDPNMVLVGPGKTGEIIWKFKQGGVVDFACLQPGHYEAGMRGLVTVN